jgi:hypothetical protein
LWFVFCAARRHFGWEVRIPLVLKVPAMSMPAALVATGTAASAVVVERWNTAFILPVAALVAAKLVQEYAIHHERWLDNITAVDAVESIWRFVAPF